MNNPPTSRSNRQSWHELLEHYTPDGWLGRLLLAAATASIGGTALFLALAFVVSTPFLWPVLALVGSGVGLAGVGLALVVLWPVYLSLIGNVESTAAYPDGSATRSAESALDLDAADSDAAATDPDDAVTLLKRRYAAGEIPEDEFERRLDDLLDVDAALDSSRGSTERGDRVRERERN